MKLTHSKLTEDQTHKLLEHFIAGTTARTVASLLNINKNTATLFYNKVRRIIFDNTNKEEKIHHNINISRDYYFEFLNKSNKKDETKYPLFILVQLEGKIYTTFLSEKDEVVTSDSSESYLLPDVVVCSNFLPQTKIFNVNHYYPYRLNFPSTTLNQRHYIDGIENFWKLTKNHLLKFNGISFQTLPLFLKELEWRYNYREPKILLKILSSWII